MGVWKVTFILILKIISYGYVQSRSAGEACTTDSGKKGTCILILNCTPALQSLRTGDRPKPCGLEGKTAKVCCENLARIRKTMAKKKCLGHQAKTTPTTTTTTTTPGTSRMDFLYTWGGRNAAPLEFPHMAILGYGTENGTQWFCGGSLISENFVLTAAHCLATKYGNVTHVKLGVHQISFITDFIQTFKVKKMYRHPDYSFIQMYHDIGLIELDRPVDIQTGVKPACLHTSKQLPSNSLIATGWGATELSSWSDILQKVDLKYVAFDNCTGYYKNQRKLPNGLIDDWQICADGGGARADTCQGDSGGPLQLPLNYDRASHTIVGITSFGIKCAVVPGIYTRVSHYVPWIESIVWPSQFKNKTQRMARTNEMKDVIDSCREYATPNHCSEKKEFGEPCTTDSGRRGTCILILNCAPALQSLRTGGSPKPCGFEGKTAKVCCENLARIRETIAEKKCLEYQTKTTPTTTTTTTTPRTTNSINVQEAWGGQNAAPLEFPHMAILGYSTENGTQWFCGGSLISENFVLTAAHCLATKYGNVTAVKLGVHQISFITNFIKTFKVKKMYRHPDYSFIQNYHDIGLIELDRSVDIQAGVKPACLHTSKQLPSNSFIATGWGATETSSWSDILQKVDLNYAAFDNCAGYYKGQGKLPNGLIDDWQICADGGGARADTCQGDSGGPLQLPLNYETNMYTIVGITSFGIKCAVVPAVYSRVSHYVPWIESIVWPS